MTKPVEDLQVEVLSLPPAERSLLLERLIVSLNAEPDIQRAWVQEAQRRDAEIESGTVYPVPGEEARRPLRSFAPPLMSNVRCQPVLERSLIRRLSAVALLCSAQAAFAGEVKVGLEIGVDGEGFLFNPVVTKINVTGVAPESLAAKAGIVRGDEITSIEGHVVKGRPASELKAYMNFGAGESRTLIVRHADGASFEAKLTKPKE